MSSLSFSFPLPCIGPRGVTMAKKSGGGGVYEKFLAMPLTSLKISYYPTIIFSSILKISGAPSWQKGDQLPPIPHVASPLIGYLSAPASYSENLTSYATARCEEAKYLNRFLYFWMVFTIKSNACFLTTMFFIRFSNIHLPIFINLC